MIETKSSYIEIPEPEGYLPFPDELDPVPVFELIERWASKDPARLAVVADERTFTFGELSAASNQVANGLLSTTARSNFPVGILIGKEPEAIIAMLGVLKAGKCFVGLDPPARPRILKTFAKTLRFQFYSQPNTIYR